MTAIADQPLSMIIGDRNAVPAAAELFYLGQLAFADPGTGFATGAKEAIFLGHVADPLDNSAGAAGGAVVRLVGDAHYRMLVPIAGIAETDKGKAVYASDNNTYTLNAGGNTRVGTVIRKDSTGMAVVMFEPIASLATVAQQAHIAAIKANYAIGDLQTGGVDDLAKAAVIINAIATAYNNLVSEVQAAGVLAVA